MRENSPYYPPPSSPDPVFLGKHTKNSHRPVRVVYECSGSGQGLGGIILSPQENDIFMQAEEWGVGREGYEINL